jgi:hypothetical protein
MMLNVAIPQATTRNGSGERDGIMRARIEAFGLRVIGHSFGHYRVEAHRGRRRPQRFIAAKAPMLEGGSGNGHNPCTRGARQGVPPMI